MPAIIYLWASGDYGNVEAALYSVLLGYQILMGWVVAKPPARQPAQGSGPAPTA